MNNEPQKIPVESYNPFTQIQQDLSEIKDILKGINIQHLSGPKDAEQILNIKEAADYINLSVPSLYRLCSISQLPNFRKGKKILFSKDELTAWIKEGRRKTIKEIAEEQPAIAKKSANLKSPSKVNGS